MSKFSKILTALLVVCLTFGIATAFLSFAADAVGGDEIYKESTTLTGNSNRTVLANNLKKGLKQYDYVTIDMDITIPDGKTAYHSGLKLNSQYRLAGTTKDLSFNAFQIFSGNGAFYAGTSSATATANEDAKISSTPGVYDHLTIVHQINRSGEGDSAVVSTITSYLYVNGKLVASSESTAINNDIVFGRFSIQKPSGTGSFDAGCGIKYSLQACAYDANGEKAEAVRTVVDSGEPLYFDTTGSLVYNAYCIIPGSDYVAAVDGKKVYIPEAAGKVIAGVKNGSEIETKVDVVDFDIPDGVEKFTLVYNPEETVFTLCEEDAKEFFIIKNSETNYTVRMATANDKLTLKRVVKCGDKELLISSSSFIFLITPENSVDFSVFDLKELKLYTGSAANWTIDVDGNVPEAINLYDSEAIRSLSDSEAALIKEEFDGILTATATVDALDFSTGYAYIAGYESNGVFTPKLDSNGGYENYKDIATLEAEKATWDEDVVYYEIVDGKAQVPGSGTTTPVKPGTITPEKPLRPINPGIIKPTDVTDLVKNTSKDNGTVDGCGILIIR